MMMMMMTMMMMLMIMMMMILIILKIKANGNIAIQYPFLNVNKSSSLLASVHSLALESQGIIFALLGVATSGAIFARASGAIADETLFALIHIKLADLSLPKLVADAFLLIGTRVDASVVHASRLTNVGLAFLFYATRILEMRQCAVIQGTLKMG